MTGRFEDVRRLARQAVSEGVMPGAVALASLAGELVFHEAFGDRVVEPHRLPATVGTIYDVASVTKAVITSVLAMQAVAEKKFHLDDPVRRHLPEFTDRDGAADDRKAAVTIRQLLAHAGGLPAHRPFYLTVPEGPDRRARIMEAAAREPLAAPPGARSLYTDLGFILLGWIIERVGGARLDAQAQQRIFASLRLQGCLFSPVGDAAGEAGPRPVDLGPVAPTERCPYRQRVVMGQVHDMNAFAMDGVAGHAGLFSTAADLAAIAQALVAAWRGDGSGAGAASPPLVERDVVREFWRPTTTPGSWWRLGWDGPAPVGSQAGTLLSRAAVGHLGFTGCSLWIEPERARVIVLLTNRIHPTVRDDPRFRAFRPAAHDAAVAALDAGARA